MSGSSGIEHRNMTLFRFLAPLKRTFSTVAHRTLESNYVRMAAIALSIFHHVCSIASIKFPTLFFVHSVYNNKIENK